MKHLFILSICVLTFASCTDSARYALIQTDYGDVTVMLYDETPKHRDNFIGLAEKGFYDSLLFHRVIDGFMIQGGDPDSKNAKPGQRLGNGGPGYLIDEEIGSPHIKGTLAAARTQNPKKQSSGSQFYITVGKIQTDAALDNFERQKKIKYNATQRELYKTVGGAPFLDQDYTVFGEVVSGMEAVDAIAKLPKDGSNRPTDDVRMKVKMLSWWDKLTM